MKASCHFGCLLLTVLLGGCSAVRPDADTIVVGAGIAGLAAALEANDAGSRVLVLDTNSVAGGHAVMAGGLFLVGTPLQADKGIADSPDLAFDDIRKWGEDADPRWVRRYVEASRPEVHDWLATLGVEFRMLLPAPGETSVPRFHFTRGAGLGVVLPMMRQAFSRPGIRFAFNTEVTSLAPTRNGTWQVGSRNVRTSVERPFIAPAVVIATGGFENDLERVTTNWPPRIARPERLLRGAGRFADGDGIDLGRQAGARIARLDHQTIFVTGLPDPRDPSGQHGLLAQNPAAIFVDRDGNRFVDESAARKVHEQRVLGMPGQSYWMIFDGAGLRELRVRGAPWLTEATLAREILDNPALVARADNIAALGEAAGLPPATLGATIARFNDAVRAGEDRDFGRFGPSVPGAIPRPLEQRPFYAMRLYPMTRKSMGGLAIDDQAQVRGETGEPIPGLFAAGEATGVAGINGSYGGSGTFLGPSILTGRIAGRSGAGLRDSTPLKVTDQRGAPVDTSIPVTPDAQTLQALVASRRTGYWHFEVAHALVLERAQACGACHNAAWLPGPAIDPPARLAQLDSCANCH